MNTLLAPQRHDRGRPTSLPDALRLGRPDSRTSLLDRLAMRVGLRLLLWSTRRPRLADDRVRHAHAFRQQEDTALRECDHLRRALLEPRL